jgi:hypothetical protein
MKKLRKGNSKNDLSDILPGTMVSTGNDLKRLEKLHV